MYSRRQKSGVSVVHEWVCSTSATIRSSSDPKMNAADPAAAEYSRASPGAPCEVSPPIPSAYRTSPALTREWARYIPSVPALQANSRSAMCTSGPMPSASATTVPDGLTAYGWDSEPTYTAPMSTGSTPPERASALRAASTDIVIVSSSAPGTDFW